MSGRARHQPDTWEKVVATCTAVLIIATVLFLIVRDRPFSDPNLTQLVRILLSLACGVLGAVIPGFLNVDVKGGGMLVRAGGALGLFVVTYYFAPSVQTQTRPDAGPPVAAGPRDPLESPGGYRAEFVKLPGEGNGMTIVWKGDEKVTEVRDSRPISFSPTDDVLRFREMGADDDLKHFLMDIGAGERYKFGKRDYLIGSRVVVSASWSTDGKTVILHGADGRQEAFRVYKHTQ